jgi:alkanesulfonate monooxygenase SsuD/methylene tetrahydromethanopterin reductase-like flavin-dependent oxidoreductase (luciferase family)
VESTQEDRLVTRLGLWLTGAWPETVSEGPSEGDGSESADHSDRAAGDRLPVLAQVAALARQAERSGFDSLWVTDRVLAAEARNLGHAHPEAYSLLGALAVGTRAVRLGAVPLGVDRRPPSIVAKIVTGIDVISHGRAVLTFGLGPADAVRGARAIEALRVGRAVLEDESPGFEGDFYTVEGAMNRPGPVQDGGVPVVLFIEDRADLSDVAVTEFVGLADAVIVGGGADEVHRVADEVRAASRRRRAGEDPAGSIQVIGIGLLPGMPATHRAPTSPAGGPTAPPVHAEVGELFEAGADGCLVPVDLATPVEALAAVGEGLGDLSGP